MLLQSTYRNGREALASKMDWKIERLINKRRDRESDGGHIHECGHNCKMYQLVVKNPCFLFDEQSGSDLIHHLRHI